MSTNTTNSTHCSTPVPANNLFLLAVDRASPASFVIASTEETYKPVFRMTTGGIRTLPYQPFFNAYLSGTQTSQTGAGRIATLLADAIISNVGGHYNTSTGEFTAPVPGIYHFDSNIMAQGAFRGRLAEGRMYIIIGPREYQSAFAHSPVGSADESNDLVSFKASWSAFMRTNETARTALRIDGYIENSVGLYGATEVHPPGVTFSAFSGYLIG